jgi:hypothetical protein
MRTLALVIILTASALCVARGQPDPRAFGQYEEQKKDKALGFIGWLLLPGAGMYYAGNEGGGIAYFGIDATLLFLYTGMAGEKDVDGTSRAIVIGGLLYSRVSELIGTFNAIDDHNTDLRKRLKLNAGILPNGSPGVTVTFGL